MEKRHFGQRWLDVEIHLTNINTGVDATLSDRQITLGSYDGQLQDEEVLKNGRGTLDVKASGSPGLSGQFNVNFPGHGYYTVKFSLSGEGSCQPSLELEDHTTPQRLISEQHEEPKIAGKKVTAKIDFLILV